MRIKKDFWGREVKITDIDGRVLKGKVVIVTGKADNDETNRDSLTLYDGKDYIFFSDNEIKAVEVINE